MGSPIASCSAIIYVRKCSPLLVWGVSNISSCSVRCGVLMGRGTRSAESGPEADVAETSSEALEHYFTELL